MNKLSELKDDPEFFDIAKLEIENELSELKKVVDSINLMRVQASYVQADLLILIDSRTWEDVTQLIALSNDINVLKVD